MERDDDSRTTAVRELGRYPGPDNRTGVWTRNGGGARGAHRGNATRPIARTLRVRMLTAHLLKGARVRTRTRAGAVPARTHRVRPPHELRRRKIRRQVGSKWVGDWTPGEGRHHSLAAVSAVPNPARAIAHADRQASRACPWSRVPSAEEATQYPSVSAGSSLRTRDGEVSRLPAACLPNDRDRLSLVAREVHARSDHRHKNRRQRPRLPPSTPAVSR